MKPGDVVTIYEDPHTQQRVEGRARLLRRDEKSLGEFGGAEWWWVRFLEDEWEDEWLRKIVPPELAR